MVILNFKYREGFFNQAIMFVNKIRYKEEGYTHSAIIIDEDKDNYLIAEALSKGFTISWYDKKWIIQKIKEGVIEKGIPKVKIDKKILYANAYKYNGTPYGFLDLFNILWYFIFGKIAFKFTGAKGLICSEAVCRLLYDASDKKIDFEKEFNKDFDLITPTDLSKSTQIKWQTD